MVRKGFKMFLYPGMEEEYEKRHNQLWPEMRNMIHEYGGHNYSIYLDRETHVLYGYLEVEDEERWASLLILPSTENGGILWPILWKPTRTTALFVWI